jgi:NADPH:quinone reductase-like Zn-dependent oxidoreductase
MRAITHDGYGPPEHLQLRDVDRPEVDDGSVLVRVKAASVNPLDWHLMRGEPSFMRLMGGRNPTGRIPGADIAGVVEAVGAKITEFRPGDEVFGTCRGGLAEYARAKAHTLAPKPASLTWEQAAAIPVAGCTALVAVRDEGRLQPGQGVLVNGASGGVGTFAVQIAKTLGANVTGVCSTRNVDLVRSLGADHVVDYTVEDFTRGDRRYDLIVQVAGNQTGAELRRALSPRGSIIVVGGGTGREPDSIRMRSLLWVMLKGRLLAPFVRQRELLIVGKINRRNLTFIASLIEQRRLTPVIERRYPLADAAEAIRVLEGGHARGKIIVTIA